MPTPATNFGSDELGRRVKMYHNATNANRGPALRFSNVLRVASELHTRCEGNKQHEDGTLGIAISNGGRDGRKPFLWVALRRCRYV